MRTGPLKSRLHGSDRSFSGYPSLRVPYQRVYSVGSVRSIAGEHYPFQNDPEGSESVANPANNQRKPGSIQIPLVLLHLYLSVGMSEQ